MAEKLPEDGTEVTAMTYPSEEHEREASEVRGRLFKKRVPFGTQCWIDGVQVQPETVKPV